MKATRPECDPQGYYNAQEAANFLGITNKPFMQLRKKGLISPTNPHAPNRPLFLGQHIIRCWEIVVGCVTASF